MKKLEKSLKEQSEKSLKDFDEMLSSLKTLRKENETLGDVLKEYKKNGEEYIYIGDF